MHKGSKAGSSISDDAESVRMRRIIKTSIVTWEPQGNVADNRDAAFC